MVSTVLIAGGTGLIGSHLVDFLIDKGCHISILTRKNLKSTINISYYNWDIDNGFVEKEAIANADAVIHLAGANLLRKKWTANRKREIISSRVQSTKLLYKTIKQVNNNIKVFIASTAIGYYGAITSSHKFTESDAAAKDYLGNVCTQWENEIDTINELGIRTIKFRLGVVLAEKKSALQKMILPFKLRIGTVLGTGKQIIPWIYIDDLCQLFYISLFDKRYNGVYNVVQGNVSNIEFTKIATKFFGKQIPLPNLPPYLMKLLLGDRSQVLLNGSAVLSDKIKSNGFKFSSERLEEVLENILNK